MGIEKSIRELSALERRFCYEYMKDFVGVSAYLRSYPTTNYRTAETNSQRKLKEPHIKEFITALRTEQESRTEVTADRVVKELARIAFFDARSVKEVTFAEDGTHTARLKDLHELTPDDSACISEITERQVHRDNEEGITIIDRKFKFHNKNDALKELGKHTGIFEKDNKQRSLATVSFTLPSNGREKPTELKKTSD